MSILDPSLPLQAAIVAAMKAFAPLSDIVGAGVYDEPPAGTVPPYVSLGPVQLIADKAENLDGVESFIQVDAWSTEPGQVEVKRIAGAVIDALDGAALDPDGFNLLAFELQGVNYLTDPDGKTRHAAMTFRALTDPR